MQIAFNRTKEDSLLIRKFRRNLKLRTPQLKVFVCLFAGLGFFIYSGGEQNNDTYTGYALVAMLFWGAMLMVYIDYFFPKLITDPQSAIMNYKKREIPVPPTKVEINDSCIIFEGSESYSKLNWNNFRYFSIYRKHIFIMLNANDFQSAVVIKQSELTEGQYNEFYDFLKKNMTQKK